MSADEFDPMIERLFARSPQMADATLFAADVEARLHSSTRVRTAALTVAGLIGGVIAVKESMSLNLHLSDSRAPVAGRVISQGFEAASVNVQGAVGSGLSQLGLSDLSLGSMGGMQMFWIAAGALIALACAGVVRLSQDI